MDQAMVQLREAKLKMDGAIRSAIVAATKEFREVSGLSPHAISVDFIEFRHGMGAREYVVGDVRVDVKLWAE